MPITIEYIRLLHGANIYYPQQAVAARMIVTHDYRDELGHAVKTWAQAVGVIIGYLKMKVFERDDGWRLDVSFTCHQPTIGGDIIRHAVDDVLAIERRDHDWNHDDALFDLRRRRMRDDSGLPLLQLRAEAQGRGVPVLPVGDGTLQFGTGAKAWRCDPAQLSLGMSITPPWAEIGSVPLIALGGVGANVVAQTIATQLQVNQRVVLVTDATWQTGTNAMLDQQADMLVLALDHADMVEHGLPFSRCDVGVVLRINDLPDEQALAAGLPALVTPENGTVILLADDQRSAALARRTATPVVIVRSDGAPLKSNNLLVQIVINHVQSALDHGLI